MKTWRAQTDNKKNYSYTLITDSMINLCELYIIMFTKNKSVYSLGIKLSGEYIISHLSKQMCSHINKLSYSNTVVYKLKYTWPFRDRLLSCYHPELAN